MVATLIKGEWAGEGYRFHMDARVAIRPIRRNPNLIQE